MEIEAARAARSELEGELRTTPASERARVAQELARAQKAEGELIDTALEPLEGDLPVERPRERGEALLLVVPTGGRGERLWRGIWQDDEGVVAGAPLSEAALRAAPAQLLPGERALRPRVVSLLLPAALEDLDLHLVPVGDRPWALQVPVRWSLDLGRAPQPADSHTALVVGDPEGGLAGARAEASEAADQLRSAGWSVQTLGRGADLLAAHPWEVGPELGLQRALRRAAEAGELAAVAGYRVITP